MCAASAGDKDQREGISQMENRASRRISGSSHSTRVRQHADSPPLNDTREAVQEVLSVYFPNHLWKCIYSRNKKVLDYTIRIK